MASPRKVITTLLLVIVALGGLLSYEVVAKQGPSAASASLSRQSSLMQSQSSSLESQSAVIANDAQRISQLQANLTSASLALATDKDQIRNLTASLSGAMSELSAAEAARTGVNGTISSQSEEITQLSSQVDQETSQITALEAMVNASQGQISQLQQQIGQLSSALNLNESALEASTTFVPAPPISDTLARTFIANYSGYVSVTMTNISDIANIRISVILFYGAAVNAGQYASALLGPYGFSTVPDTVVFPVTPGSVNIYIDNPDSSPQNATLTITYYY